LKLKIGIPRAFLYYRYNILWKTFFTNLGCTTILSPETTRETLENGKKEVNDECCLPTKIYLGAVFSLIDKCDYILVPRIVNYGKNNQVCVRFNGIYDMVKNSYQLDNILDYNIDVKKHKTEILAFMKIGLKITKNIFKVIFSYYKAKRKEKEYYQTLNDKQELSLNSNNLKILIVAHPYVIYDKFIGSPITSFLRENNVTILYADRLSRKTAIKLSKEISKTLYWTYSKELIGSIIYYKDKIDGIIFLSAFPCGPDSLVNELTIRKIKDIPITNIILDEQTAEAGLHTRLESFLDIIKERRDKK